MTISTALFVRFSLYFSLLSGKMTQRLVPIALRPQPPVQTGLAFSGNAKIIPKNPADMRPLRPLETEPGPQGHFQALK